MPDHPYLPGLASPRHEPCATCRHLLPYPWPALGQGECIRAGRRLVQRPEVDGCGHHEVLA